MALCTIWDMYEDEKRLRLRKNIPSVEENLKMLKEKEKMENDLRFFKVNFAKMVVDKEKALEHLGSTQIALCDLNEEFEKKKICGKSVTNIHQVVRAKAQKERDLMKQERDLMKQEKDNLVSERDKLKKEKELEYTIGDLFKHKEGTKCNIRKMKEILDEFE
ncbi:putative CBL-interacting protein kinase 13 [Hordeum vulgare]|nr:putative CBL-interacting protein kinase 13 [Hordeum vulgare]